MRPGVFFWMEDGVLRPLLLRSERISPAGLWGVLMGWGSLDTEVAGLLALWGLFR